MRSYSMRDVQRVLRLSPDTTRNLIKAGFVRPARGARREYRFSFQDLIVLRTARALIDAKVPARRIRRSLESLRRELPESVPLSGLSISAVGDHVVVRDGDSQRQVESGQYLLGLDVSMENGVLRVVEHREEAPPAQQRAHRPVTGSRKRSASRVPIRRLPWSRGVTPWTRMPATPPPGPTWEGCCTSRA